MSERRNAARARLRALLALLSLWDAGLGIHAAFFAHRLERLVQLEPQREPLFVRGVGVMWLFVAYIQLLGFRDPERHVRAVQLSIVFRVLEAALCAAGALLLLGPPRSFVPHLLAGFAALNVVIILQTSRWLSRLGLRWIEI